MWYNEQQLREEKISLGCHFFGVGFFLVENYYDKMNGVKIGLDMIWIVFIHRRYFLSPIHCCVSGSSVLLSKKMVQIIQKILLIISTLCRYFIRIYRSILMMNKNGIFIMPLNTYRNYFYYFTIKWCRHSLYDFHSIAILSYRLCACKTSPETSSAFQCVHAENAWSHVSIGVIKYKYMSM